MTTSDDVKYEHDILDDGFVLGNTITGFDLKIWLRDDTVTSRDFVCTGFFSCGWVPVTSPDSSSEYGYLYIDKSVLTATGSAVPLPGALGLIGIGLVGLGVATRRKQA